MTFELSMLAMAAILTFLVYGSQGLLTPLRQGFGYGLGARDEALDNTVLQARAKRTVANQLEAMAVFTPLVLVAHHAGLSSALTHWGAGLFVAGRVAYWPLYWAGVPVLRTLAWAVGVTGMLLIAFEVVRAMLA